MKMAKRTLAVVLALLMAFSVFSIVGSASEYNPTYTKPELWDGAGTITYGLDVYKVEGSSYTKLDSGVTLAPGDVVEVRVSFGTDFITSSVNTLVFYDTKYFVPYKNGAQTTTMDGEIFKSGFAKTYEADAPVGELANGGTATFYQTLSAAGGLTGGVNSYDANVTGSNWKEYYPKYMREGYDEGATVKKATPVAAKYADLAYTYAAFAGTTDSAVGGQWLSAVPYATYYSFQMQVKEGADSNGATTAIFIPAEAQRTTKSDFNKLCGGTSDIGQYAGGVRTQYGQGIDATNAEFTAVIGESGPQPHTHTWVKGATTDPTCTEQGYTTYTCTCGESKQDDFVNALGHDYVGVVTQGATCTTKGVKTFTCSRCNDSYTEEIPTIAHNYVPVVTAPTCTTGGYHTLP